MKKVLLFLALVSAAFGQTQAVYTTSGTPNLVRPVSGTVNGVFSITSYGAKGDATTDNAAITAALAAAQTQVTGGANAVILIPSGTWAYSQSFTLPASNITIRGDNATLISTTNSNYPLFNASGKSNLVFDGIIFDGHYSGGATTGLGQGLLNLTGCSDVSIRNCTFQNVAQVGIWMQGANVRFNIHHNTFNAFFCGIFSNWDGTNKAQFITIDGNIFRSGLGSTTTNFSGAIKMAGNDGTGTNFNSCYTISNNSIYQPGQMGIELNNGGNNSMITGGTIYGAGFAVSLAGVNNVQVTGVLAQASDQYFFEVAAGCSNTSFTGCFANGLNAAGALSAAIGYSVVNSTMTTITGGVVQDCTGNGLYAQDSGGPVVGLSVTGVTFSNCTTLAYLKTISNFQFTGCYFLGNASNTYAFIALDTSDGSVTDGKFSSNYFYGAVIAQGVQLYFPTTSNQIKNVEFSHNHTTAVTSWGAGGPMQTVGSGGDAQCIGVRVFDNIDNNTTSGATSGGFQITNYTTSSSFSGPGYYRFENGVILVDCSGGARTITLDSAQYVCGRRLTIMKIDSSGNAVTINTVSSQTIRGKNAAGSWQSGTSSSLAAQGNMEELMSDGGNYLITNSR